MIAPYTKTLRITIPSTGDEAVMKVKVNCVAWVLTRTQTHAKAKPGDLFPLWCCQDMHLMFFVCCPLGGGCTASKA